MAMALSMDVVPKRAVEAFHDDLKSSLYKIKIMFMIITGQRDGSPRHHAGVSVVHKLKYEHLHLAKFSKMWVDLAVQVRYSFCTYIYIYLYMRK